MQQAKTKIEVSSKLAKTLGDRLDEFAKKFPTKIALVAPKYALKSKYSEESFSKLKERADNYANGLSSAGIKPGQVVLLMVPPGVEFVSLWFALSKIGAVVMLIDPGMGKKNLFHCIEQIKPEALISVPLVHYIKKFAKEPFKTVKISISTSSLPLQGAVSLRSLSGNKKAFKNHPANLADISTIAFTTGSTGIPKGVVYTEKTLTGQLEMIRDSFSLKDDDVSFPAFLPFSIFSLALGHKTVMASFDPRKPASVVETKILKLLKTHSPTYSFGSPAFWGRIASYALKNQKRLSSLEKIIMFGAPVSERVLKTLDATLSKDNALSFTPYGATEALPLCSISSSEILEDTMSKTKLGYGVCVGSALSGIELKIIKIIDEAIASYSDELELGEGEVGEVIVSGDVVTEKYYNRDDQTELSKIVIDGKIWHRMGDLGYLDNKKRLWFCGRKNHRVHTANSTLYTVPVESVFNEHKEVFKSALVGVNKRAVLCVELKDQKEPEELERIEKDLFLIASEFRHTKEVSSILFKKKLPVDFRHNAKIIREELQVWASKKLKN